MICGVIMCVYFVLKLLTLLFSTPITIISCNIICNVCSLPSISSRLHFFVQIPNSKSGGLSLLYLPAILQGGCGLLLQVKLIDCI